jgi:lysyl-tRNA synthetase, class II
MDNNIKKSEQEVRVEKLNNLKNENIQPYPAETNRTHTISESLTISEGDVVVAGRIMMMRVIGKLTFCKIQDESGSIQIVFKNDELGEKEYKLFTENIDMGDIIQVSGNRMKTQKEEESVMAKKWTLLNKALRPLPDKYYGLQDKELRFRKRYLDLITNKEVFELFKTRSRIVSLVREFLNNKNFLEVETPILQTLYGGTNAKPFKTNINAYKMDMYLRVAPELYLKRLLVGGYEKLYEIGKNFRNEGVDATHNPEFTMIEWYEAYADYNTMMDNAEELYKFIAKELFGKYELQVGEETVNIEHKWPRVKMVDSIKNTLSIDVLNMSESELLKYCEDNNLNIRGKATKGQMIMEIFEDKVAPTLISPTWIIDYPKEVSPLAREHRENPDFVERFECYIYGKEIGDGWTEIIDPQMQRSRFENEQKGMKEGNEEAHPMDEDFLEALEYGMPPMGGIGIGIDRLVMLFTNKWLIREILLFPIMKKND